MRNIISITVLFSLIVTFANYDIVRVLTNGGPRDLTHVFASYAFQVGILAGNIPRGAAVSLFMFPILARDRLLRAARHQPAQPGGGVMSASDGAAAHPRGIYHKAGSLRAERRWALWSAYISLIFAAIIMLAPPFYMLLTSIKTERRDRRPGGQPLVGAAPDARELLGADRQPDVPRLLLQQREGHDRGGRAHHGDLGAGGLRAGADALLGQPVPGHRRVPHLPGAGHAAVHPALPDRRRARPARTTPGGWCWSIRR